MNKFILDDIELIELREAHKAERNRIHAYKINAVILLGTGWKLKDVKEALLLSEDTIRSYVKKYQSGGINQLISTNYISKKSYLSDQDIAKLRDELEKSIYLTTASVIEFVKKHFGIKYSISGMRDLLHRLGYEYKKPKLVPGNPDIDEQEIFAEQYESFMANKPGDEEVIFIDAVHPEHNTMCAYGWIKRGETRKIKTNSGRQRLNLHGAINIETLEMTVIESNSINSESTVELLETISQKYPLSSKIHIVLDNASYHYSKVVKAYLESDKRLNLVFLPPYSPELNYIERVWKYFKKNVLYNKYYENLNGFRKACIKFFKNIEKHKPQLTTLLAGGFEGL